MSATKILIFPKTKVGELLDNYPELESVLMEMSPAFEKLKNPLLRKTVARVASLQQVAVVGRLNVDEIVNRLRKEVGQIAGNEDKTESNYLSDVSPEWFKKTKIIACFDASPIINSGGSPMSDILRAAHLLKHDEILELRTPFIPAPIIDILKEKGYEVYTIQTESIVLSYIYK